MSRRETARIAAELDETEAAALSVLGGRDQWPVDELPAEIDADVLKDCVARHLARTENRVSRFRRRTKRIELFKALAASTVTGVLALGEFGTLEPMAELFRGVAIVISAALAVITAWDALIKPKRQWVLYVSNRNGLSLLTEDIEHAEKTNTLGDAQLRAFYERYQKILLDSQTKWAEFRETED